MSVSGRVTVLWEAISPYQHGLPDFFHHYSYQAPSVLPRARCFKQGAICFFQQPKNEKWVQLLNNPWGLKGISQFKMICQVLSFLLLFLSFFLTIHPFRKLPDISRKIGKGMEMNRCFQSDTVSSIPIDFNSKGWLCGERWIWENWCCSQEFHDTKTPKRMVETAQKTSVNPGQSLGPITKRRRKSSGQIIIFHQPRFPWNKGISPY